MDAYVVCLCVSCGTMPCYRGLQVPQIWATDHVDVKESNGISTHQLETQQRRKDVAYIALGGIHLANLGVFVH